MSFKVCDMYVRHHGIAHWQRAEKGLNFEQTLLGVDKYAKKSNLPYRFVFYSFARKNPSPYDLYCVGGTLSLKPYSVNQSFARGVCSVRWNFKMLQHTIHCYVVNFCWQFFC